MRVLEWPEWVRAALIRYRPSIQADELQLAMSAASAPHWKESDRRRILRKLARSANPFGTDADEERPEIEVLEYDPDKAREWFESMGIRTE